MALEEEHETLVVAHEGVGAALGGEAEDLVARRAQRFDRQLVPARVRHGEWRAHAVEQRMAGENIVREHPTAFLGEAPPLNAVDTLDDRVRREA